MSMDSGAVILKVSVKSPMGCHDPVGPNANLTINPCKPASMLSEQGRSPRHTILPCSLLCE